MNWIKGKLEGIWEWLEEAWIGVLGIFLMGCCVVLLWRFSVEGEEERKIRLEYEHKQQVLMCEVCGEDLREICIEDRWHPDKITERCKEELRDE